MDRRLVHARVRRHAVHRRGTRRPVRTQGSAPGRARAVPRRRPCRAACRRRGAGDRCTCRDGVGGGVRHAVDTVDPDERLLTRRTTPCDRALGRHRRWRRSARTAHVGTSAQGAALLVGISVPRERAAGRRRAARRPAARATLEGPGPAPARPSPESRSRSWASVHSSTPSSRLPHVGWLSLDTASVFAVAALALALFTAPN